MTERRPSHFYRLGIVGNCSYIAYVDDQTDEDLFRALPEQALTFKIGISASRAKYNLRDQRQVARLMERLQEAGL